MRNRVVTNVNCPKCGAPVRVEFGVKASGHGDGNTMTVNLVQSGPMICECGFKHIPDSVAVDGTGTETP